MTAAEMYDAYGALAFTLAYRVVGDRATAEDVVQDAFLNLWRHADKFDPARGSLQAWICRVVRNRAIDRTRGSAGRARRHQSLDVLVSVASADDVAADVLQRDEARAIAAAVAALPAGQREAVELAYYGGYSQSEIATRTGIPLGTIKGRTRAAMRSLASTLAALQAARTTVADAFYESSRAAMPSRMSPTPTSAAG